MTHATRPERPKATPKQTAARLKQTVQILIASWIGAVGSSLITSSLSAEATTKTLDESTIIEVINEVNVLSGEELKATPARPEMRFQAPEFLQTGRRSRARLEADDGTITRVGANTLFSFEEKDRTINLKKGSLLFHSPSGQGGGRIVTASATASVVGTTITVTATEDGGFKLLVLEGTAQVTFPNGDIRILEAGQMTFVLPSEGEAVVQKSDSGEARPQPGKPGPILNFDLKRLRDGSRLLNGFQQPLSSAPIIEQMIERQQLQLESGELDKTDARIVKLNRGGQLVLETEKDELINSTNNLNHRASNTELERLRIASESELTPQVDGFQPQKHFFPWPGVQVPEGFIPGIPGGEFASGLIAKRLNFGSGAIDVSPLMLNISEEFDLYLFRATDHLNFGGSLSFEGFQGPSHLWISALNSIQFSPESSIDINNFFETFFFMNVTNGDLMMRDLYFFNPAGQIGLGSDQEISLTRTDIEVGYGGDLYVLGDMPPDNGSTPGTGLDGDIFSPGGMLQLNGRSVDVQDSYLSAGGTVLIAAEQEITVDASDVHASVVEFSSGGQITVSALNSFAQDLRIASDARADISNSDFTSMASVNLEARTLVLSDIQFASGTNIQLGSELGQLADNPNTGASAATGYVNFINNVTYDGNPAQNFVSIEQGGTAEGPAKIDIYTTGTNEF